MAAGAVAGRLSGHAQAALAREVDHACDVGRVRGLDHGGGLQVDREVPGAPSVVPALVAGQENGALEVAAEARQVGGGGVGHCNSFFGFRRLQ